MKFSIITFSTCYIIHISLIFKSYVKFSAHYTLEIFSEYTTLKQRKYMNVHPILFA